MITNQQFIHFLEKLHASTRAENGVLLTEWENKFLASWLNRCRQSPGWFTTGRREAVNKMWMNYGGEINWPHPMDNVTAVKIPDADADGCEFYVKLDGVQQHCNAPAAFVNRNKFRYCAEHAEQVQKDLTRRGGHMELRPFKP